MFRKPVFLFFSLLFSFFSSFGQRATITGIIRDEMGKPLDQVLIADDATGMGAYTNAKGYYMFSVASGKNLAIIYFFQGYDVVRRNIYLVSGETKTIDITLKLKSSELAPFVVKDQRAREQAGSVLLDISKIRYMPSTIGGIESLIKLAVGGNNELTSQYSVRGGNFDENLVYVNDFEIYRPFLVRTGQQEGLSFINADLVANVSFSVGGFEARYGDKMSSVLDVTYKRPTEFAGSVSMSLLGGSLHLEGTSKNHKLTYLVGARQKTNQYLLQSQPTKGIYNPSFTDLQTLINYRFSSKWELEAIGNYARNRFIFFPEKSTSSFGVLNAAYQLNVFYTGTEFDQFDSRFAGFSLTYRPTNPKLKLKLLASGFQTNEFETYDLGGAYLFGELQTDMAKKDFGQIKTYLGAGGIHSFARNYLDVNVGDAGFRGSYDAKKNFIQFGVNGTYTLIHDALHEWERRDSAGFNQPYDPYVLNLRNFFHSSAAFDYTRLSGFIQDNIRFDSANRLTATAGVRFNYSFLNNELNISPRIQTAYKPDWKKDWVFKLSAGKYVQPPFYREMRDFNGGLNLGLLAQKSYQAVVGTDYNFKMYKRPFKVTMESYYKYLWDLDPYRYENVRIRYTAQNNAIGRVYGGEVRLYGDLVEGATSWISVGILKAEQKVDSPGIAAYDNYFPLPTDQRFMLGFYFEDYLPKQIFPKTNKNYKVHLSLLYSEGLPVYFPAAHLNTSVLRLPSYKRADIGFSALLLDSESKTHRAHSFFNHIKSVWGSLEVFNLLSIQNTLSYTWIQDQASKLSFAVPSRLTSRLLNVKLAVNF